MNKNIISELIMGVCMVMLVAAVSHYMTRENAALTSGPVTEKKRVVVLDAGHGGDDPGKIGINHALEKDINLAIVEKIRFYLEQEGVEVVLTRTDDNGLYTAADGNKKRADMRKRCEIIDQADASLVVSIHQNSYHDESVKGAQVFYYKSSAQGQRLAELVQKRFDFVLGEENRRSVKANDSYYLLLHTACPIVIVECGFLSNWTEAEKLIDPDYQDQVAWSVYMGIMQYLNDSQP